MIYKYRPININTLKSLLNNNLYCSNPIYFNDPFDANSTIDFSDDFYTNPLDYFNRLMLNEYEKVNPKAVYDIRNATKEFVEKKDLDSIKKFMLDVFLSAYDAEGKCDIGIVCFSRTFNNILMWAHYADEHKGIVLGFDQNFLPFKVARNVNYPTSNELFKVTPENQIKSILEPFFIKSTLWSYEEELRFLNPNGPGLIQFPPESLKSVYFGCRSKDEDIKTIIKLLNTKKHRIQFYRGHKDRFQYSLVFDEVK